ncbi:hypothetical protein DCC79_12325 [bacterium]|nr:MAG: hypothetical protein DCC79_12325 [bacterium]
MVVGRETVAEVDVLGFVVLRWPAAGGAWPSVTGALVAVRGGSSAGARCTLRDRPGAGALVHRLDGVGAGGTPARHEETMVIVPRPVRLPAGAGSAGAVAGARIW